jgi:hypothetical protein
MYDETKNTCAEMDNHDHEHNGPQKIGKLNNLKVIGTIKFITLISISDNEFFIIFSDF